jgi:pyruvate,orthophosphate dikinase
MSEKFTYAFTEGNTTMRDLLRGKGANLAEMTRLGMPVPPGFTIPTTACNQYYSLGGRLPDGLMSQVHLAVGHIENELNKKFGGETSPLLVSVRSGAKFSMPGMMDTILNLGLNESSLAGLIRESGDPRFGYDAYRRFIMMFSDVVLEIPKSKFERILEARKAQKGVTEDLDLSAEDLQAVADQSLGLVENETGKPFPADPWKQLELAITACLLYTSPSPRDRG